MTSKPDDPKGRTDAADDDHSSAANGEVAAEPIDAEPNLDASLAPVSIASMGAALQQCCEGRQRLHQSVVNALSSLPAPSSGIAEVIAGFATARQFPAGLLGMHRTIADAVASFPSMSTFVPPPSVFDQAAAQMKARHDQFERMRRQIMSPFDSDAFSSYRSAMERLCEPLAGIGRLAEIASLQQRETLNWLVSPHQPDPWHQSQSQIREIADSLFKVPDLSAFPSLNSGFSGMAYGDGPGVLGQVQPLPGQHHTIGGPAAPPVIVTQVLPGGGLLALDEDEIEWLMLLRGAVKCGLSKEQALRLFHDIMAAGSRHQLLARDSEPQEVIEAKPVRPSAVSVGVLIRDTGAVYKVRFKGKIRDFPKLKGIAILKILTDRPDNFFSCLELRGAVAEGSVARSIVGENDAAAQRYGLREGYDRLNELKEEIQEAEAHNDWDRKASIESQHDELVCKLSEAAGGRSRGKKVSPELSRARMAVTAAIKYAYSVIESVMPELEQHLRERVKTGYHCRYMKLGEKN